MVTLRGGLRGWRVTGAHRRAARVPVSLMKRASCGLSRDGTRVGARSGSALGARDGLQLL